MKKHVEWRGFNSEGVRVATGLVTPAGVCGFSVESGTIHADYTRSAFGFCVTDRSVRAWKRRVCIRYKAVRFQRVIAGD